MPLKKPLINIAYLTGHFRDGTMNFAGQGRFLGTVF